MWRLGTGPSPANAKHDAFVLWTSRHILSVCVCVCVYMGINTYIFQSQIYLFEYLLSVFTVWNTLLTYFLQASQAWELLLINPSFLCSLFTDATLSQEEDHGWGARNSFLHITPPSPNCEVPEKRMHEQTTHLFFSLTPLQPHCSGPDFFYTRGLACYWQWYWRYWTLTPSWTGPRGSWFQAQFGREGGEPAV